MRTLIFTCIISAAAFSAKAQVNSTDNESPIISRVCLWNADQDTWKALGLKRAQIARMQELREQYPAVVDGQWVVVEEIDPEDRFEQVSVADPTLSTSISGPAAGSVLQEKNAESPSSEKAMRPSDLQFQLRAVLTPVQLQKWAEECDF